MRRLLAGGVNVVFEKGPNLLGNPEASAALDRVAAFLRSTFLDPVTIVVDAELTPLALGSVAETESEEVQWDYDALRSRMIADAAANETILGQLPTFAQLAYTAPDGFGVAGMKATRANLLALGVPADQLQQTADSQYAPGVKRDMSIRFNSDAAFDFNRADGIDADKIDFEGEALHEIGHGLGFDSAVTKVDETLHDGQTAPNLRIYPLDLFRLAPGAGASDFTNSPRLLVPGNTAPNQVLYDGGVYNPVGFASIPGITAGDVPMSTGLWNGDGAQAGHWRDDASTGVYLGVMDPTGDSGVLQSWTDVDTRALGLIGWDVVLAGSIMGRAYNDLNGNGAKDVNDPGLANWRVYLDGNGNGTLDGGEASVITDTRGRYEFGGLLAGNYAVRVIMQPAWTLTDPPSGLINVDLGNGEAAGEMRFGVMQPGSLGGEAYHDVNGNGAHDAGEPGLAGRTVYLDSNDNEALDGLEPTALTDAAGRYSFTGLLPGGYVVRQALPEGWLATAPAERASIVDLTSGAAVTNLAFGSAQPGSLSGRVFHDLNGDGARQRGEPVVAGVTVYIDNNGNGVLDEGEPSIVSDDRGRYTFGDLAPGNYTVRESLADGWAETGSDLHAVSIASGTAAAGRKFGNARPGSIRGAVYNDANGNGRRDAGEAGLAGRKVYIDENGNGRFDRSKTTLNGSGGTVAPGDTLSQTVAGSDLDGKVQAVSVTLDLTHPAAGQIEMYLISPSGHRVELVSGAGGDGQNFTGTTFSDGAGIPITEASSPFTGTFRPVGRLGELAGESPNGLWTLEITNRSAQDMGLLNSWSVVFKHGEKRATTDAGGKYIFSGLMPGPYSVRQVSPAGWIQTWPASGQRQFTLISDQILRGKSFGSRAI